MFAVLPFLLLSSVAPSAWAQASCTYQWTPRSPQVSFQGGTVVVNVFTAPGCPWTASVDSSTAAFTEVANASGQGTGSFLIITKPYGGVVGRNSLVWLAGELIVVTQPSSASVNADRMRFVPVAPCRITDTREFARLDRGMSRTIDVAGSRCNIPHSARAYSLNVTAVPVGYLGFLTVWQSGWPRPNASLLNSWNGRIVANAAIVRSDDGLVNVYADDPTDVVIDINGYFVPYTDPGGLEFHPVTPCRVADTRGLPRIAVIGPMENTFAVRNRCGIPASAEAYSFNVTAVPERTMPFLTIYPAGQPRPLASTLNSFDGQVVPNAAIVPAGRNGDVTVYTADTADIVLDINGYFSAPGEPGGLEYRPLLPCRLFDTRLSSRLPAGALFEFPPEPYGCGAEPDARAYVLNTTAVPVGFLGFVTLWPAQSPQPLASTLNSWNGQVVANMAIVPGSAARRVATFVSDPTHLVVDITGYFAPRP